MNADIQREDLKKAYEVLDGGGLILYPTDTIWGIGCDATNIAAIEQIYAIKRRNETQTMLVLVDSVEMLTNYIELMPANALELIERATRPTTVIYPKAKNLATNIIAEDGSIGIRIVKEPFCQQLIKLLGKPIVSTSANISGLQAPACFNEIAAEIKTAVDYIVRWRQNDTSSAFASSIIKIDSTGNITVLR